MVFDYKRIQEDLKTLYQATYNIDKWARELVDRLIYVGEYSLALDEISYAYLNNRLVMPAGLFEIFERLAVEMDMEKDPEFEGVAQLRAEAKARPGLGVPNSPRIIEPSGPTIVEPSPLEDKKDAPPAESAKPGEVGLSDKRRESILDGDGAGGGHGPGRNAPGASSFPSDWSDDQTIQAISDIANDSASNRHSGRKGRTIVKGTWDGVDIEIVIDRAGKNITTAYPTNTSAI